MAHAPRAGGTGLRCRNLPARAQPRPMAQSSLGSSRHINLWRCTSDYFESIETTLPSGPGENRGVCHDALDAPPIVCKSVNVILVIARMQKTRASFFADRTLSYSRPKAQLYSSIPLANRASGPGRAGLRDRKIDDGPGAHVQLTLVYTPGLV